MGGGSNKEQDYMTKTGPTIYNYNHLKLISTSGSVLLTFRPSRIGKTRII